MSTAELLIQVATLSDVPSDRSRNDGVPSQVVTVTSVGVGTLHQLSIWATAPEGLAAPTLTQTAPNQWTFNPGAGLLKSFGLDLVVDGNTSTPAYKRRTYRIPDANGLFLMLHGEESDPDATLTNNGPAVVAASNDNTGGSYTGWAKIVNTAITKLSAIASGVLTYGVTGEMVAVGATADAGAINKPMRIDARLAHGNQTDGAMHAAAIASGASGFQTGTDKARQDALWARLVNTTAPLTGGGALSGDLTLAINAASGAAAGSMSAANFTKLAGIEAGADVTDFGNVSAALAAASGAVDFNNQNLTQVGTINGAALLSLPVADNTALLKNNADPTKLARFDLGSIGAGQTRVTTLPNADMTFVASALYQFMKWNGTTWAPGVEQLDPTTVSGNYGVADTDRVLSVTTSAPRTITLPGSPRVGHILWIVDNNNLAGTNNITVQGNGYNINQNSSKVIANNNGSLIVHFNGSAWEILNEYTGGGASSPWTTVDLNSTGSTTLSNADTIVSADSQFSTYTATLPTSGNRVGQLVFLFDRAGYAASNNLTLAGNGYNINGSANYTISKARQGVLVVWTGTTNQWCILAEYGAGSSGWTEANMSTLGSGATLTNADTIVHFDASSQAYTLYLPSSGLRHNQLVYVYNRTTSTANALTLNGNGFNINGSGTKVLNQSRQVLLVVYNSTAGEWTILAEYGAPTTPTPVTDVNGFGTWNVTNSEPKIAVFTQFLAVTVNLPGSPSNGQEHEVVDRSGHANSNNITVSGNGHNINGGASITMNAARMARKFTYNSTSSEWMIMGGYL